VHNKSLTDLLLYKSQIHLFFGFEVTLLSHVHVHFTNRMLPKEETYIKVTLIQINYNGILRTIGYIIKAVCFNVSFCVSFHNVQWAELSLRKFSQVYYIVSMLTCNEWRLSTLRRNQPLQRWSPLNVIMYHNARSRHRWNVCNSSNI